MSVKAKLYSLLSRSYLNRWIVLLLDVLIALLTSLLALETACYFLDLSDQMLRSDIPLVLGAAAVSTIVSDLLTGVHKQIFRFSSLRVSVNLLIAVLINGLLNGGILLLAAYLSDGSFNNSMKLELLYGGCYMIYTFLLFLAIRGLLVYVARLILNNADGLLEQKRVMVYGVGSGSEGISSHLEHNSDYRMLGFLTKDPKVAGHEIGGHRVYSFRNVTDLYKIKRTKSLDGILFTDKRDFVGEGEQLIHDCESIHLETYLMPEVMQTESSTVGADSVRRIKIEDLLFRNEINVDDSAVRELYAGKVVMVTGAAGSIGSEIARQIASFDVRRLILLEMAESPLHTIRLELEHDFPHLDLVPMIGDVRNRAKVELVFRQYRPDIVLHAAAYKHVPLMEEHPCESVMANLSGTRNVADMCVRYGVERMVMISTDKAVNPTNVMGACKRACEIYIQSLGEAIRTGKVEGKTIFITTRFGNVLGSNGSVIELFRKQIAEGGPVTVTDPEIVRFFMSIPEACRLVLQASTMADKPQIFVFDMGEAHKIDELARRMIRLAGYEPDEDIKIIYTGLRPGEKLYEEVLATTEDTEPTEVGKIRIAKVRPNDYEEVAPRVERLIDTATHFETEEAVRQLKQLIPEFVSNNSPYAKLDEELKAEKR